MQNIMFEIIHICNTL